MKRRITHESQKTKGFYINDFIRGFWGLKEEGKRVLKHMGLRHDRLPFSVGAFLQSSQIFWKDFRGNRAMIRYSYVANQLKCSGYYLNKRKSYKMILEWDANEERAKIKHLESEAIGDLCRKCIHEIITSKH